MLANTVQINYPKEKITYKG
jgi:hypothetical protein